MQVTNPEKHELLGAFLRGKFDTYDKDRRQLEVQWLKNLRQYKAIYDPEVKIPEGKSKVYPKDTRTKIVGWVAKMMEMVFPAQEKNWSLVPTPHPNIAQADLATIIDKLQADQTAAFTEAVNQAAQSGAQPPAEPEPVTSDMIESAVQDFAKERAAAMEKECEDQLADERIDYPELCKKIMRRSGIYGYGVAEGPQVRTQIERTWKINQGNGQYEAVTEKIRRPYYTVLRVWDVYPDLTAQTWADQEGIFTRRSYARHAVRKLADREEFYGSVIREYLKEHTTGNYKQLAYEAELDEIRKTNQGTTPVAQRQFEIIRWYGFLNGQVLKDVGVEVPEEKLDKEVLSDVWMLGDVVIKADTAPFGEKVSDMFHVYIPEEDEDSALTGSAKVETLSDSQAKLCAIDRAIMDNMSESASSIKEVNDDLVDRSHKSGNIYGGMTIHRSGDGAEANFPAIRIYDIPNHTPQLRELRKDVLEVFDVESNLPSWLMGNAAPLGEAFRTSNNMSMMAGGGDMVTKDDVRSFDKFVKSFIGSIVRWNMEFNKKTDIKGDFQVMPKGTISLVSKEVRGAALDQLVSTLTPRQQVLIDERGLLEDRFKARDLPLDRLKKPKDAAEALAAYDQSQAQAAGIQQGLDTSKTQLQLAAAEEKAAKAAETQRMLTTKMREGLSKIAQNLAKAKGVKDATALQSIQLLLDQIGTPEQGGGVEDGAGGKTANKPASK